MSVSEDAPKNQPSYNNTDSSWTNVNSWIIRATEAQNKKYGENAGIKYQQMKTIDTIETYILTTAFGSNGVKQCSLAVSLKFWYNHVYRSIAAKIRKKIQKRSSSTTVEMNVVFVIVLLKDKVKNEETNEMQNAETTAPVFYFKDSQGELKYIDLFARVYDDWNRYLTSNCIDPALICYSKDGHYGQDQETKKPTFNSDILPDLAVIESPACGTLRTIGRYVKKTLAVITPILTVASIVGIIPKLRDLTFIAKINPVIQITNKYFRYVNLAATITFSLISIGDKVTHDDLDVFAEITAIAASVLNSLGDDLTKRYFKGKLAAGQTELTVGQNFFFNLFAWSRCATAVAGVLTTLIAMMYKPECSAMDYFLLASSFYSCYGILTSPKSAQGIFNQVKQEYLNELLVAEKNKDTENEKKSENDQSAEKKTESDQFGEKDKVNTGSDADVDGNGDDKGPERPLTLEAANEELIKERDELAKKMIKDENDEAGKAAYKYYEDNFVTAFKGTDNEYVMNKQLIRMMKYAPDVREMFCEIALTETTLSIKDDILLVNGQLNIDGAALAQVHNTTNSNVVQRLLDKINGVNSGASQNTVQTDREILLEKTKDFNDRYKNLPDDATRETEDNNFLNTMQHFTENKNGYRFFFEANARNFERQFQNDMNKPLDQCKLIDKDNKNLFQNMSTADKQRLHQQLNKHATSVFNPATGKKDIKKYNSDLFDAGVTLANARGCTSVRSLTAYIGIIAYESRDENVDKNTFIKDIINGKNNRLAAIQANIDQLMPNVETNLENNKNHRGFHSSLEAYEHGLQHGQGGYTQNLTDRWNRMETYLNKTPLPIPDPKWNQSGTKEGHTMHDYDYLQS